MIEDYQEDAPTPEEEKQKRLEAMAPEMLDFIKRLHTAFYIGPQYKVKEILEEAKIILNKAKGR